MMSHTRNVSGGGVYCTCHRNRVSRPGVESCVGGTRHRTCRWCRRNISHHCCRVLAQRSCCEWGNEPIGRPQALLSPWSQTGSFHHLVIKHYRTQTSRWHTCGTIIISTTHPPSDTLVQSMHNRSTSKGVTTNTA